MSEIADMCPIHPTLSAAACTRLPLLRTISETWRADHFLTFVNKMCEQAHTQMSP